MTSSASSIAIIGAGYAGCAAAVELAGPGVVLFEASRSLGGRARAVASDHDGLDNGQHILVGAYSETLRLMTKVGADPEKLLLRLPLNLHFPGRLDLQAPRLPRFLEATGLHLLLALIRAQGLDRHDILAALRFLLALKKRRFRLDQDEAVTALLMRHQQPEKVQRLLWLPLCIAALNTPAASASAQVFANVLRDTLAGPAGAADLLLPRVDLSRLFPLPAADYLVAQGGELRLACPVRQITPLENGDYRLSGDDWQQDFHQVILAVAPYHAMTLLPSSGVQAASLGALAALNHEAIVTCYLGYDAPVRLPRPMVGLDGHLCQWLFDRSAILLPESKGPTPSVIAAVISASDPQQHMYREQLAAAAHAELQTITGPLPPPAWSQVITEKRATFACRPHLARPAAQTGLPGVFLAGDYVASDYPATLESAVRSGIHCAALSRSPSPSL